jgi:hypothetical protein
LDHIIKYMASSRNSANLDLAALAWAHWFVYSLGHASEKSWYTSYQILAVHTFGGALRRVGLKALAFGFAASGITLVGLIWFFSALWVGEGTGIHEDYETPSTPVRDFDTSSFPL